MKNLKRDAERERTHVGWLRLAERNRQVLLTNFDVNIFSVGSKLRELELRTGNMCLMQSNIT